jgi:hypothetical protein
MDVGARDTRYAPLEELFEARRAPRRRSSVTRLSEGGWLSEVGWTAGLSCLQANRHENSRTVRETIGDARDEGIPRCGNCAGHDEPASQLLQAPTHGAMRGVFRRSFVGNARKIAVAARRGANHTVGKQRGLPSCHGRMMDRRHEDLQQNGQDAKPGSSAGRMTVATTERHHTRTLRTETQGAP